MNYNIVRSVKWIIRSYKNNNRGSSAYYSKFYKPLRGWAEPYPETTGYIIPTLLKYGLRTKDEESINVSMKMSNWLLKIQNKDGSFNGGFAKVGKYYPSVFNTAQIIFGLLGIYEYSNKGIFLEASYKAGKWLVDQQDSDGLWRKYSYKSGFSPSYYSRVAWPLLLLANELQDNYLKERALLALNAIVKRQLKNKAIRDWGFKPGEKAYTHTIAYTVRGLLESAIVLNDFEGEIWAAANRTIYKIFRIFEISGKLAGRYSESWKPDYRFSCLTGNCQIALCFLRLFEFNNDVRLLNAATKLIEYVEKRQVQKDGHPNDGGIPGSSPIYGPYMRFRYPNWAVKFYIDAKIAEEDSILRVTDNKIMNKMFTRNSSLEKRNSYSIIEVC